jgi:hypothetical protein
MSVELTAISETDRTFFSPDYQTDCDRARAEEGTRTPSLPRTQSRLRRAPRASPNRKPRYRHETALGVAVGCGSRMAGVHSSLPSERPSRLSSLSQSNSGFDFTRLPPPPNTRTSRYYFRHSNKHAAKSKFAGSQVRWKGCLPSFCCE